MWPFACINQKPFHFMVQSPSACLSLLPFLSLLKFPNIRPSDLSIPSLLGLLWYRQSPRFFSILDPEPSATGHLRIYKGFNYYHYYNKKINSQKRFSPSFCFPLSLSPPFLPPHKAFRKTEAVKIIMTDHSYLEYISLMLW